MTAADRRRLLVLDRVLTALSLTAILILAGHAPNWLLPVIALLYGATSPLSSGAFSAVLPEVAGPDLLDAANAFEGASITRFRRRPGARRAGGHRSRSAGDRGEIGPAAWWSDRVR